MTHVFFSKSLTTAFHKILVCFQIRKMNHRNMTIFSVPRKHCEYTFNCALLQNCWGTMTDKADRGNKRPPAPGWCGVDKCPPYKKKQKAVVFPAHCEGLARWVRDRTQKSLSKGSRQTDGQLWGESGALRWTWLSHTVGGEGRSQVDLTLGKNLTAFRGSKTFGHGNLRTRHIALFCEWHF